jgi:uncharacterized FAD-dependent dehydrogenase
MKGNLTCGVCVIGLGPAGLGTALTLAKHGYAKDLICLDKGGLPETRVCGLLNGQGCQREHACQIISGVGGCFMLGGGKLSDYPAGSGLARIIGHERAVKVLAEVIELLGEYMPLQEERVGSEEVVKAEGFYSAIGFEYRYFRAYRFATAHAREACNRMREDLISGGCNVLLDTELEMVERSGSDIQLSLKHQGEEIVVHADKIVLAMGRSGRKLLNYLDSYFGLGGIAGQLDVGVRLDFPSALLNNKVKGHQDLKLLFGGARTFCVCEGGRVAAYQIDGVLFTEGSADVNSVSGRTNLGILRRFPPSKNNRMLLTEIRRKAMAEREGNITFESLQAYLRGGRIPQDSASRRNLPGSAWFPGRIDDCFPPQEAASIREAVRYFADRMLPRDQWSDVGVLAPEVDYSGAAYPVKSDFAIKEGVYMVGDSTGLFRGIAQAFASGVVCAESLKRNG